MKTEGHVPSISFPKILVENQILHLDDLFDSQLFYPKPESETLTF
jgi:hypothetical protein